MDRRALMDPRSAFAIRERQRRLQLQALALARVRAPRPQNRRWPIDDSDSDSLDGLPRRLQRQSAHRGLALGLPAPTCPGWNLDYAAGFIANHLEKNNENVVLVIEQICRMTRSPQQGSLHRAFEVLNQHLFADKLKDAVDLTASSCGHEQSGVTYAQGAKTPRIVLALNRDTISNGDPFHVIGTLIHHMIHAYYLAVCGAQKSTDKPDGRLGHGEHFGIVLSRIKSPKNKHRDMIEMLNLGYGHRPLQSGRQRAYSADARYFGRRRQGSLAARMEMMRLDTPLTLTSSNTMRSVCPSNVKVISPIDLESWYKKNCAPYLGDGLECCQKQSTNKFNISGILESTKRTTDIFNDTYEFIIGDKPVVLEKSYVDKISTMKKKFSSKRFFIMPVGSTEAMLKSLFDYICKGQYGPSLRNVQNPGYQGPPVIMTDQVTPASWPEYLTTDIRAYRLAAALEFDQFRDHAQQRLSQQHITYNNPTKALWEIYKPEINLGQTAPLVPLRSWAMHFLMKYSPCQAHRKSNYMTIVDNPYWADDINKLKDESSDFRDDIRRVEKDLQMMAYQHPQYPVPGPYPYAHHEHAHYHPPPHANVHHIREATVPPYQPHYYNYPQLVPQPLTPPLTYQQPPNPYSAYPGAIALQRTRSHSAPLQTPDASFFAKTRWTLPAQRVRGGEPIWYAQNLVSGHHAFWAGYDQFADGPKEILTADGRECGWFVFEIL